MMTTCKVLGWTEDVTTCDCCGKSKLSGTFAIETAAGEIVHYGSVCTTRNTGIRDPKGHARMHREEMIRKADAEWMKTPEYAAWNAVWNGGAPCTNFAPISEASKAVRIALRAQFLAVPA